MSAFLQVKIANVLDDMGKPEEAMELYQEVLRVRVATLGPEHPHPKQHGHCAHETKEVS